MNDSVANHLERLRQKRNALRDRLAQRSLEVNQHLRRQMLQDEIAALQRQLGDEPIVLDPATLIATDSPGQGDWTQRGMPSVEEIDIALGQRTWHESKMHGVALLTRVREALKKSAPAPGGDR